MMPRRRLLAASAAAALLLACCLGGAQACPSFATKAFIRKTVAGGKQATLVVKITNRGSAPVSDAALALALPNGFSYRRATVSPKPKPAPALVQDGSEVAWTGLSIAAGKTRTVRVKLALDQCAGDDLVPSSKHNKTAKNSLHSAEIGVATFTGPVNDQQCLSSTTVMTTVRRPKTAIDCAPPLSGLCSIPSGTSANGKAIYGCGVNAPAGPVSADWVICGRPVDLIFATPLSLQQCADYCAAVETAVGFSYQDYEIGPDFCSCYDATEFPSSIRIVQAGNEPSQVYAIGATVDGPVPTVVC